MDNKIFSKDEKSQIYRDAEELGDKETMWKWNISPAVLNKIRKERHKGSEMRKREYKPLLFTTTVRNPSRVKSLLYVLKQFDNKVLTNSLAENIMGELIKYGLYRPIREVTPEIKKKLEGTSKGAFANKILTNEEVKLLLKANPQNHKEAGFEKGWASRFATVFDFAKELGFVYFNQNEKIQFSEIGLKLANVLRVEISENTIIKTEEHPEFEQQAFLHSFAKSQRKNPFVKVLNDNIPLILLLETIKKINEDKRFNGAGISKLELPLIIFWKNNNSSSLYERIVELRTEHGYTPSWEVIVEICTKEIMEDSFKKFNPKSIMIDYPDEFIRKMRLTGLISLRGGGRFLDINKNELDTIDYILKNYSIYPHFENGKEYFDYMAKVDNNLISFQNKQVTTTEKNKYLDKWVKYFGWDTLKEELMILQTKKLSKDEILKYLNNPTRLEFLIAIAIKSKMPNTIVKPNYPCDDEGLPTSTAGGQGNQGDIECFEDKNGILVEVTMSEGRNQTMMEVWPIARHLKEFSKNSNNPICHFIAPSIFEDTQKQIKFVKQEDHIVIQPRTIELFIDYLDNNEKLYN